MDAFSDTLDWLFWFFLTFFNFCKEQPPILQAAVFMPLALMVIKLFFGVVKYITKGKE